MVQKLSTQEITKSAHWIANPHPGHLVHFYQSETELFAPLSKYLGAGMQAGETCILIATQSHIAAINNILINTYASDSAKLPVNFLIYDANELLDKIMVGKLPDWDKFMDTVGLLAHNAEQFGKPIRAYGEMVAILWKSGRKEAVTVLEQFWNRLAKDHTLSLYCAYPKLQFIYDAEQLHAIEQQHTLILSADTMQ